MNQSNEDLAENKVLILYLLNKISDGIKSDNLYKIISIANNINYFYFQELVTDLIETNLIGSFTKDEDTFIKITSEGQNALSLTKSLLPGILKLKADNAFKDTISSIEEEASIITEYTPKNESDYTVTCKIVEKNMKLWYTYRKYLLEHFAEMLSRPRYNFLVRRQKGRKGRIVRNARVLHERA